MYHFCLYLNGWYLEYISNIRLNMYIIYCGTIFSLLRILNDSSAIIPQHYLQKTNKKLILMPVWGNYVHKYIHKLSPMGILMWIRTRNCKLLYYIYFILAQEGHFNKKGQKLRNHWRKCINCEPFTKDLSEPILGAPTNFENSSTKP